MRYKNKKVAGYFRDSNLWKDDGEQEINSVGGTSWQDWIIICNRLGEGSSKDLVVFWLSSCIECLCGCDRGSKNPYTCSTVSGSGQLNR